MPENKLELVVSVEVDKANQSIKSVNASLSGMEQSAVKAARGASGGIDAMTASMIKGATAGNLLADMIQSVIRYAKDFAVDAIKDAAHVERLEQATLALAKANGIAEDALRAHSEAIQAVGYEDEQVLETINKLLIADIDLSKATGLAKMAKDLAALRDTLEAGDALDALVQAVEFGNARALRSVGLRVEFEKQIEIAELKLGRALSEHEKQEIRLDAVMQSATRATGASAQAADTAEAQWKKLAREFKQLKQDLGKEFLPYLREVIASLREMVKWAGENRDLIKGFAQGIAIVGGLIATYKIADWIWGIAASIGGLRAAMLANPFALLATGVVAAGAIIAKEMNDMQAARDRWMKDQQAKAIRNAVASGKTLDELRKMGLTDEQIREAMTGQKGDLDFKFGESPLAKPKKPRNLDAELEQLKRVAEIRKRQAEAERETRESALAAEAHELTGPARITLELQKEAAKFTSFLDDKGVEQRMRLTAKTRENLERELAAKVRAYLKETAAEEEKLKREEYERRLAYDSAVYQRRLQNDEEIARKNLEHLETVYAFEEQRAGFARDARLRAVDAVDAQTLGQKLAVEQQKAAIEIEYLQKVHEVKQALYDIDTRRMMIEEELTLKRLGYKADEITARIAELTQQRQDIRAQSDEANDAAVQATRESAAIRQAQLIRNHNRQIFDSLKRQAEGVFDALLSKSQSIWSAIGNSLKTALLTAIKDVVTSRVAAMLMQLFTGQRVTFAQSGGGSAAGAGGWRGILGGFGSAVPVFGGGGGGPIPGGSGGGWGTPPFIPNSSAPGTSGAGGGIGGWGSMAAGYKDWLTNVGNIGFRPERWRMDDLGNMTKISGARGVGGMKGGAMLAGGSILVMDGLRRGGWAGVGETTAGGALIGAKFGGPIGAIIGAIAGFVAGMIRKFMKGATEKAREKIKALYGVDIQDKGILKQIVDTAKSAFGGNLDVAIRSPQIVDLIQLYAMTTGQSGRGMPETVHAAFLSQSGGRFFQSPGYENGASVGFASSLSTLGGSFDRVLAGQPSGGAVINLSLQLDGKATTRVLQGEVASGIRGNPRAVQQASLKAAQSSYNRREQAAALTQPLTTLA